MGDATALAIIGYAVSVGVGLIFLAAGLTKLRHRALLPGVIANYRLLPVALIAPVAVTLPWVEMAVGVTMIAGIRPVPQLAGAALLLAFAGGMAVNIRRGRTHIDCGCGLSTLRQPLGRAMVARNLALAALLLLPALGASIAGAPAIVAGLAGGVALFLCHLLFNAIDALARGSAPALRR